MDVFPEVADSIPRAQWNAICAWFDQRDLPRMATPASVRKKTTGPPARVRTRAVTAGASPRKPDASKAEVAGVSVTHPERVVAATDGITKLDVVRYHVAVGEWLLPHIAKRPLAVVKCPGSDLATCFFQKHAVEPFRQAAPDSPPYLHLPGMRDVIAAVQNGVFEFHSWGASFPRIDRPDRITLDLDPDDGLPWSTVLEACERTRALLDRLELRWFVKTTGGKGLHFVLPIARRYGWDEVKAFARGLAMQLATDLPALFTATMSKRERGGRVFVDYLRNADGATAVAAYSLRARAGLPVSMPVTWAALASDIRGTCFNLRNVPTLLKKRRADPWADYDAARQAITAAMRRAVKA